MTWLQTPLLIDGERGNHLWYRCSQTLFCSYPNLYCFRSDAPCVTFKGKPEHILKIKIKKNDVVITTQANEWMDYKLLMHWIRKVVVKYTKEHHALLVFDSFKGI